MLRLPEFPLNERGKTDHSTNEALLRTEPENAERSGSHRGAQPRPRPRDCVVWGVP